MKLIDLKDGVTVASVARVVEDKSLISPENEEPESTESENEENSVEKTESDSE